MITCRQHHMRYRMQMVFLLLASPLAYRQHHMLLAVQLVSHLRHKRYHMQNLRSAPGVMQIDSST